jgi:hypothetical protein
MRTEKSSASDSIRSICINCGRKRCAIVLTHPLISWCRRCRSSDAWAELLRTLKRNVALLKRPGLSQRERTILAARANGYRLDYIAQRLRITLQQAEEIETRLVVNMEAPLPKSVRRILGKGSIEVQLQIEGNVIRIVERTNVGRNENG